MYIRVLLLGVFLGGLFSVGAAAFFVQVQWLWLLAGIVLGAAGFIGLGEAYFQLTDPASSRLSFVRKRMEEEAEQEAAERRSNRLRKAKRTWPTLSELELVALEMLWDMHWRDFEQLVARLYEQQGYPTTWTGKPGDHGADVIIVKDQEPFVIQCKNYAPNTTVSPNELRSLVGAMAHYGARRGTLLTSNVVSAKASEYAHGKNFDVVEGEELVRRLMRADLLRPQERNHSA